LADGALLARREPRGGRLGNGVAVVRSIARFECQQVAFGALLDA
jgi:hypothetical protein